MILNFLKRKFRNQFFESDEQHQTINSSIAYPQANVRFNHHLGQLTNSRVHVNHRVYHRRRHWSHIPGPTSLVTDPTSLVLRTLKDYIGDT